MISNLQETKVNDGDLTVTITQFNGKVNKVDITIISSSESNSFLKGLLSKEKNSDKLILKPWHIFSKVTIVGQVCLLKMLLRLEYGISDCLASLYKDQCLNVSNCCILSSTSCSIIISSILSGVATRR